MIMLQGDVNQWRAKEVRLEDGRKGKTGGKGRKEGRKDETRRKGDKG